MVILETPSRVLRRINAAEGADMPSLPSLPGFDDSDEEESDISRNLHFNHTQSTHPHHLSTVYSEPEESEGDVKLDLPVHSTPSAGSSASAIRGPAYNNQQPPSSTASAVRFASSIASRSRSGSNGPTMGNLSKATSASAAKPRAETYDSFDVSGIPSLPDMNASKFSGHSDQSAIEDSEEDGFEDEDERKGASLRRSKDSVPDVYLPPEDDDPEFSLTDALESVSRASSPFIEEEQFGSIHGSDATPRKKYDYTEALRPEPEVRFIPFGLNKSYLTRQCSPPHLTNFAMLLCASPLRRDTPAPQHAPHLLPELRPPLRLRHRPSPYHLRELNLFPHSQATVRASALLQAFHYRDLQLPPRVYQAWSYIAPRRSML